MTNAWRNITKDDFEIETFTQPTKRVSYWIRFTPKDHALRSQIRNHITEANTREEAEQKIARAVWWGNNLAEQLRPEEPTYTQDEVIELLRYHLSLVNASDATMWCPECQDDIKAADYKLCLSCKCEDGGCDQLRHPDHSSLCGDHADEAHEAAYWNEVNHQIDEARGA